MYIYSCNRGDDVTILIDTKSGEPIYNQIYSQIKNQIISGELRENDMLPSIRGLAKDLRISFITTKHAYEELEQASSTLFPERVATLPRRTPRSFAKKISKKLKSISKILPRLLHPAT